MSLTDAKLRALKGKAAPFKVSDAEGLHVLVAPGGSKMWRLAYRYNGKQKTLALGRYPVVSLLDARKARIAVPNDTGCIFVSATSGRLVNSSKRTSRAIRDACSIANAFPP